MKYNLKKKTNAFAVHLKQTQYFKSIILQLKNERAEYSKTQFLKL